MGSGPAQKSIGDTVYERLKESILCHEFPGGTRLREGTLAENYDVSRTPVRNAIIGYRKAPETQEAEELILPGFLLSVLIPAILCAENGDSFKCEEDKPS